MKNFMIMGAFWAAGLLMGSWWNQSELTVSRVEIERLNHELAARNRKSLIPEMTRMMTLPETRPKRPEPADADRRQTPEASTPGPVIRVTADRESDSNESDRDEFARQMSEAIDKAGSPDEAYEVMEDLWKTRRDIAKSALVDNLGLTPSEIGDFDAAIDDMNEVLADKVEKLIADFEDFEAEPAPEDAFRMANEFTGVFVGAYDAMDDVLPGDWREESSVPLDLTAFIDPGIFKPFMDMEGTWNNP